MGSDPDHPVTPRRGSRVPLSAEVALRRSGVHAFRVRVFDLSAEGCKIEFVERPEIGERLWVKFDGLDSLAATVRWIDGHRGGVQFERPIYDPVFRRLIG